MTKAMARLSDGTYLLVLGISAGNVARLQAGDPIYFDPAAIKIPPEGRISKVALFYGHTDADLTRTLRGLIGPETVVHEIPEAPARVT